MPPDSVNLGDAQTILDSITDAFFSLNGSWEFSYVNRQTEKTLGLPANQLLGKSLWEVYPGTAGSEFERMYRKARQDRIALTFCSYYPEHDRWYDVNVYPAEEGLAVYFRNVTARMQEEVRRNALFKLADIFRDLTTAEDITFQASQVVGETLKVSRVGFGTVDPIADTLHVVRDWNAPGVESLAGRLNLRDYGSFIDDLKAGRFLCISDVGIDDRTAQTAAALKSRSAGSLINVPILEQGRLVAIMYVNEAQAREWTDEELAFVKEVAERARTASERQHNREELGKVVTYSERRRRLYETLLENTPDLAYVFDLNHRFTYANKVLLKMWGLSWEDAIGKNCLEIGYEPWHADMHDREIEQVIASKQSLRGEVPFHGTNGRRIYEYIFVPVLGPGGDVEAIAGTTRDVTERRQAEDALEDANRRKDEFLAMLAHELRNPLAPISAAAEVLETFALDQKRTADTARIISRQVKHLTALVDDLLDVSRVTRGLVTINQDRIDLKSVIYHAVEQATKFIETQRHHLRFDLTADSAYVMGDQKRLVQIVTNLLNNAAKYTPAGGAIHIRLSVDGDVFALSVEDNGIGIPADLQPHVFDLFTQADRTSDRTQGGLGIGLALAKNLAEQHGGKISCFSEGKGRGSRFTLSLPRHILVADPASSARANPHGIDHTSKPLRILVVDDNADAAQTLALYLEAIGHQVFVEESSQAALARASLEKPDVCILDIGLPEMDGYELAHQL